METLALNSFRLQNFKAVCDSGVVEFGPLTAFIGNNGSGKSSLVEGLETLHTIVVDDLDVAFSKWSGFDQIWSRSQDHSIAHDESGNQVYSNPMIFNIVGNFTHPDRHFSFPNGQFTYELYINRRPTLSDVYDIHIQKEAYDLHNRLKLKREFDTVMNVTEWAVSQPSNWLSHKQTVPLRKANLSTTDWQNVKDWQFLALSPESISGTSVRYETPGRPLAKNGSNLAAFLLDVARNKIYFDGIIEVLKCVLPYASALEPRLRSALGREVYLEMTEEDFKLPGWVLSQGTLRILALLAVLRHPTPPPLIIIEEIENGLDPRSIHLIVEEMRNAVESGRTQIILTTHSPYLLDLLTLDQIVLVERTEQGPVFNRPGDSKQLKEWSKRYGPGKLYTMNRLGEVA